MAETVHVGGGKSKASRWRFAILVLAVVVVAGGAGVGLRWLQQRGEPVPAKRPQSPVEKSQNLALSGDFAAAHKELDSQLKKSQTSQQKYDLYMQIGSTYANEKKYEEAIKNYKLAADIKQTQDVYEALATAAELMADKQAAIGYYKLAIQHLEETPITQDDKESYEAKIRALGGQP